MKLQAIRYHDISCGHRVVGHEGKCAYLHGHNYRVHFTCEGLKDEVGRVIDFSVIKQQLCMWLEDNWDHKMIIWEEDPLLEELQMIDPSVTSVPFNPTAENMAEYLFHVVAPSQLEGSPVRVTRIQIDETRKCSAAIGE